jgi:hypothetical protein
MRTYTNTKEIPAKLLYDLLLKSFASFYTDATKNTEEFSFGLGESLIALEKSDGTTLFTIEITNDVITLSEVDNTNPSVKDQLERFIESCLA